MKNLYQKIRIGIDYEFRCSYSNSLGNLKKQYNPTNSRRNNSIRLIN